MFEECRENKISFRLFGDITRELEQAREEIPKISDGKISLSYSEKNLDILAELKKESSTDANLTDEVIKSFIGTFSKYIYADENVNLNENAVNLLKISRRSLCTAESFTGGAVAKSIVEVPGASQVFYGGFVTYNTLAKEEYLGVSHSTVLQHTVVSREVAFEMAKGLLLKNHCDVAVATTGYASPTGNDEKPCGLCFVSCGIENRVEVTKHMFSGSRTEIIEKGKNAALFLLNKMLKKM